VTFGGRRLRHGDKPFHIPTEAASEDDAKEMAATDDDQEPSPHASRRLPSHEGDTSNGTVADSPDASPTA
jgi:hypothetical protein